MNNEPNFVNPTPEAPKETPVAKVCPVCRKEVPADAIFCGECGYNFNTGASPSTPPPQPPAVVEDTSPLKMSDYLHMFFAACIPLVNLILLLIWSFSSGVNVNRRNYSRAYLIITAIMWVIYFVFLVAFIGLIGAIGAITAEEIYMGMIAPFIFH